MSYGVSGERCSSRSVVIIGAGMGGLSAAAFLAKGGFRVTVIDRLSAVGGRIQTLERDGFRFDMGPSWYWMPDEHDRWFRMFGENRQDLYAISRVDPSYRIFFTGSGAVSLDLPANLDAACDCFESIESGAGNRLREYLDLCERRYRMVMDNFIYRNWRFRGSIVNRKTFMNLPLLRLMSNYRRETRRFFRHPHLLKILEFPSVFLGSNPQKTPAIYTLMNHIDFCLGTWYPAGGFRSVAESMRLVAERQGVQFMLDTEARGLVVERGAAARISEWARGRSGRRRRVVAIRANRGGRVVELDADIVACNADYHFVEQELLAKGDRSYSERYWRRRNLAPSALNFYVGIDCKLEELRHHTFFFDHDWDDHFDAVYHHPRRVDDPLFYIHLPSHSDPTAAPRGRSALFILVPIAPGLELSSDEIETLFQRIIARIERCCQRPIAPHIMFSQSYTVKDYQRDFHSYRGNAFGLGQTLWQTASFRPNNRSRRISNLYYCGHYTTPGTGTTMSMISGEMVARRIIEEWGAESVD